MIKISIPNNNINERKYILDIFFNEFLGLDFKIEEQTDCKNWKIQLQNGLELIVEDHFFNKFPQDLEYLNLENIPKKIEFTQNTFTPEKDIPVIFGNSLLEITKNRIVCGIDIFASSFFMLARWEEYVNRNRDKHNRFPATESLAFKNGFLDRPVVNEYLELLKNMFLQLDSSLNFKKREYQLFLTHDVDELYQWKSWKHIFRVALGDIIKRKSLSLAFERVAEFFLIKRDKIDDPFDTFDWLMDKSDAKGVKSRFYFMSGGVTPYDNRYKIDEPKSLKLIKKIKERGHIIGIHPSYNAYNNFNQFQKEKKLLEQTTKEKIVEGREHYLRFEIPTTWQIWEDSGMEVDSTCGYADKEGFRCGTGDEFSVFNILSREKLKLKERPLAVMEGSFTTYQPDIKPEVTKNNIKSLIAKVKKYNGNFVFLWHNSSFNTSMWKKYHGIYEKVLK